MPSTPLDACTERHTDGYYIANHTHCVWCRVELNDGSNRCDVCYERQEYGAQFTYLAMNLYPVPWPIKTRKTSTKDIIPEIEKVRLW